MKYVTPRDAHTVRHHNDSPLVIWFDHIIRFHYLQAHGHDLPMNLPMMKALPHFIPGLPRLIPVIATIIIVHVDQHDVYPWSQRAYVTSWRLHLPYLIVSGNCYGYTTQQELKTSYGHFVITTDLWTTGRSPWVALYILLNPDSLLLYYVSI